MDFKQIEAFVNVIKYKSFSKAAEATFFNTANDKHAHQLVGKRAGGYFDRPHGEGIPTYKTRKSFL